MNEFFALLVLWGLACVMGGILIIYFGYRIVCELILWMRDDSKGE